jgi:hypothetical protein
MKATKSYGIIAVIFHRVRVQGDLPGWAPDFTERLNQRLVYSRDLHRIEGAATGFQFEDFETQDKKSIILQYMQSSLTPLSKLLRFASIHSTRFPGHLTPFSRFGINSAQNPARIRRARN